MSTVKRMPLALAAMMVALTALLSGCGGGSPAAPGSGSSSGPKPVPAEDADPATLKVALLPDQDAGTIIKNNQGLKDYLEKQLGKKVDLVVSPNYAAMVEAARQKHIHVAFFGPVTYVQAVRNGAEIEPFAALVLKGKPTYYSCLIVNTGSGIAKVEDLKGKTIVLGDPLSTSSSYAPRYMLLKAGLKEGLDYEAKYVGKHDAVARNVEAGNAPAGGMMKDYFEIMLNETDPAKKVDGTKVKLLATSEELVEFPWTMQTYLKPELKEKIKQAYLTLKDKEILKHLKNADGFAPVTDKDYASTREIVNAVDAMTEEVKKAKASK